MPVTCLERIICWVRRLEVMGNSRKARVSLGAATMTTSSICTVRRVSGSAARRKGMKARKRTERNKYFIFINRLSIC